MSDALERIREEEIVFSSKVLSLNLPVGAEEYHEERG
jgi:hypothetical protein